MASSSVFAPNRFGLCGCWRWQPSLVTVLRAPARRWEGFYATICASFQFRRSGRPRDRALRFDLGKCGKHHEGMRLGAAGRHSGGDNERSNVAGILEVLPCPAGERHTGPGVSDTGARSDRVTLPLATARRSRADGRAGRWQSTARTFALPMVINLVTSTSRSARLRSRADCRDALRWPQEVRPRL